MTPQPPCCPNPAGCARGQMGPGNIVVHRHVEPRYRCPTGGHTFAATTGTPCSRVPTAADVGTIVLIAHAEATLSAGMWLVGGAYNFCWWHGGLRVAAPAGAAWKWQERTPALAAGLTNHRWTMPERLRYHVPLSPWGAAQRRGRPPKPARPPVRALAA